MDPEFWIKSWKESRTAFNQQKPHEKLTQYFPRMNPRAGQSVLVPLCGKTIDMIWLASLGLKVHGVELYEGAVEDFFKENKLEPVEKHEDRDFVVYSHKNITISCGDFFKYENKHFDFIYDRAALVALPAPMRTNYAGKIAESLKSGGKYLLVVYEYDQSKMEPPPFSVNDAEVWRLYQDAFEIHMLESEKPKGEGPRLSAVETMLQNVYLLHKR